MSYGPTFIAVAVSLVSLPTIILVRYSWLRWKKERGRLTNSSASRATGYLKRIDESPKSRWEFLIDIITEKNVRYHKLISLYKLRLRNGLDFTPSANPRLDQAIKLYVKQLIICEIYMKLEQGYHVNAQNKKMAVSEALHLPEDAANEALDTIIADIGYTDVPLQEVTQMATQAVNDNDWNIVTAFADKYFTTAISQDMVDKFSGTDEFWRKLLNDAVVEQDEADERNSRAQFVPSVGIGPEAQPNQIDTIDSIVIVKKDDTVECDTPQSLSERIIVEMSDNVQKRIFLVYGHDRSVLQSVESVLYRVGCEPVVFSREPRGAATNIEFLEKSLPECDAVIAIMTPDDEGRKKGDLDLLPRARQNVLIEAGFALISKRSRSLVIAIGDVEIPSDFDGINRIQHKTWSRSADLELAKELARMLGLTVDIAKL